MNHLADLLNLLILSIQNNLYDLCLLIGMLWGILIINKLLGGHLFIFGLIPRNPWGIVGIFTSPFIHQNGNHLFFNMIPLFVLANFLLIPGWPFFIHLSLFIMVVSGGLLWLFGKKGIHIGASGVITGYWGYLIMKMSPGDPLSVILGMVSIYYFGGIFFGIFPSQKGVSWEGHLFGLISGIIASYLSFS
jgi:membrane associated rhomboid family serine protease